MYGDFLKVQEETDPHQQAEPQSLLPPLTAKKRHILGKGFFLEPIRYDAVPEISEAFSNLARKERHSHGSFSTRNESQEWEPSNNTIPETLNSSREWNHAHGIDKKYSVSQSDVRSIPNIKIVKSTPVKFSQPDSMIKAPRGKENFFTPRKGPELASASTPAQARCPLAALPVDSVYYKDTTDGVNALPPDQASTNIEQASHGKDVDKSLSGSSRKINPQSYNSEGFRTPQCKSNAGPQNILQQNSVSRQRLYGVSTSKFLSSNIPLHPAVLACQEAKRLRQHDAQCQPSMPLESSQASRRLVDLTPLKTNPSAMSAPAQLTPGRPALGPLGSQSHVPEDKSAMSSLGSLYSKRVDITPLKATANPTGTQLPSIVIDEPSMSKQSAITAESSVSSTWVPHPKVVNVVVDGPCPLPTVEIQQSVGVMRSSGPVPVSNISPPLPSRFELSNPAGQMSLPKPTTGQVISDVLIERHVSPSVPQEPIKSASSPPVLVEHVKETVNSVQAVQSEAKKQVSEQNASAPGHGQIVVNGKTYNILSLLGRGGSSKVFQVIDSSNSQLKAVKCVNLAETEKSICDGYLNEIKLLADLQECDCVIRMFDHEYQRDKQTLFVVMEKGDTDLSKLMKEVNKSKRISAAMIVYYWTEMLNAVNYIHKHGTIHSDLKPANFLLVSGRLKLIDFGIASSIQEDMTSVIKDNLTGTYNYISPEALCASSDQMFKISYKSDVWSLGCILYCLVYGRTPFQHITNEFQKMNAIVSPNHRIQFPDPPIDGCPSALVQAMKLCLVRNPKERASVDELLQLPYLEYVGPERGILSQVASLAASVGLIQDTNDSRCAAVVRSIQRLIIENEQQLPFLGGRK